MSELFRMPLGSSGSGWHQIQEIAGGCAKAYQYKEVRKVQRYERYLRRPLSIGLLCHAARAQWFFDNREGDLWREAMHDYKRRYEKANEQKLAPGALDEALKTFSAYVAYWKMRPQEWTDILAVEYGIGPKPVHPFHTWATRSSRLDSIERWKGRTWIGEAKSCYAGGRGRLGDQYELHGQVLMGLTLWGPEETKEFGELAGVLLDPMVKGSGKRKPTGAPRIALPMDLLKPALQWFKRDLVLWLEQAKEIHWNSTVPRTMVCMRSYGACEFRDLCRSGRNGALSYVMGDGTPMIKWKPGPGQKRAPWE